MTPVDLHRDAVWPRTEGPFAGDRDAGLVEQRAARARPGLSEPLGRAGAEGETRVHEVAGQVGHRLVGARLEYVVADAPRQREAVFDGRRLLAVEQVGCVHRVPAGA